MGIAGSGKGTQGKMLADKFGLHLVSMGDIFRIYLTGEQRERILSGKLLADKETIDILDKVLSSIPDEEELLLDGFPRTIDQAEWLLKESNAGRFDLRCAIHLAASRKVVKDRLIKRARIDDNEQSIEARFDEFEVATTPIINWLEDHDVKVFDINAERPIKTVNQDLSNIIQKLFI